MSAEPESSLARFARTRASVLIGQNYSQSAFRVQLGIGIGCCLIGQAMAMSPLFGAPHSLIFAAIGPTVAGVTNIIVPLTLRRKFSRAPRIAITITPEARTMLNALTWKYVWGRSAWYWTDDGSGCTGANNGFGYSGSFVQPLKDLPAEALDTLEQGAFQYNRISAALSTPGGTPATVTKLGPKVVAAADQAMLELLHQAYYLTKFPEGKGVIQKKLEDNIGCLKDLADRLEALALSEPTFTERLSQTSDIQAVLEELKLEQMARSELGMSRSLDELNA